MGGVRKIRVLSAVRGAVWVELSPGRVSVDMCGKESVGGLLHCVVWDYVVQPNVGLKRRGVNTYLVAEELRP